jgi:hypothetical protein
VIRIASAAVYGRWRFVALEGADEPRPCELCERAMLHAWVIQHGEALRMALCRPCLAEVLRGPELLAWGHAVASSLRIRLFTLRRIQRLEAAATARGVALPAEIGHGRLSVARERLAPRLQAELSAALTRCERQLGLRR